MQLEDLHDNDEMEMSDDDNKSFTKSMNKRTKFDNENLKVSQTVQGSNLFNQHFCTLG